MLQTKLADLVGACVVHRDCPKAVTEVRYLNDDGLLLERQEPQAVDHVLVKDNLRFPHAQISIGGAPSTKPVPLEGTFHRLIEVHGREQMERSDL